MSARWTTVPHDQTLAGRLAETTGLPPSACAVLAGRGYTDGEAVDAFLNPRLSSSSDPFDLPDMERAVARLRQALAEEEPVLVFGDYDVDGITSTALMVQVLSALGATVVPFLPHRVDDGYGLGVEPVERCVADHQPGLILTVDCGTNSVDAVDRARALGVDVIVTDHHEPGEHIAPACAVVNPKRLAVPNPLRDLAGVGVAFKVCHALLKDLRDNGGDTRGVDLRRYLDLVAIGTIADMVPLAGENRVFARHGLLEMNRSERIGVEALKKVAGIQQAVDAYHIGFLLGPRLNAAGRLGTALSALELMCADDSERAAVIAEELDAANRERQQVEAQMVEEAMRMIDASFDPNQHFSVVAAQRDWHPGVVGIVASRLTQRYHRPAIVIAIDEDGVGRGSCRSVSAFNMVEGLTDCGAHLLRYGGHAMAAGLQIKEANVEAFRAHFNQAAQKRVALEDMRPEQRIDAWISLRDVDWRLIECLERMAPFGLGNPKPVWAVRRARLLGPPRIVGEKHVKMTVLEGNAKLDAIAFNMADREIPDGDMDMAFQLSRNVFRGRETIQMNVQDIRPAKDD